MISDGAIREASGLTASQMTPGVYWTINDSGNAPLLFAFDETGQVRGVFHVTAAQNQDWEGLHAGPGAGGGPALYIAHMGDNRATRREGTVYRVAEPLLDARTSTGTIGRTEPAEAFTFTYPDGARDAESLLVHPQTGELLIVTKEFSGWSQVYRYPPPLDGGRRAVLEKVGELDVPSGASLASIWRQTPRVSQLEDGQQGEGLTYGVGTRSILTIGEGAPAHLYQVDRTC